MQEKLPHPSKEAVLCFSTSTTGCCAWCPKGCVCSPWGAPSEPSMGAKPAACVELQDQPSLSPSALPKKWSWSWWIWGQTDKTDSGQFTIANKTSVVLKRGASSGSASYQKLWTSDRNFSMVEKNPLDFRHVHGKFTSPFTKYCSSFQNKQTRGSCVTQL